jgi:hypothetical protein
MLALFWLAALATPDQMLTRIRAQVLDHLQNIPNYTCSETLTRYVRPPRAKKFNYFDKLRLEVAYVDKSELYAMPGEAFQTGVAGLAAYGGPIGSGSFALHLSGVFGGSQTLFHFEGEVRDGGRALLRFTYGVPLRESKYLVLRDRRGAYMPYRGSFDVDPSNMELARLEVVAEHMPAELRMQEIRNVADYGFTRIGDSRFLLPTRAEMTVINADDSVNRNVTEFTACRQYSGESKLSFGDAPDVAEPQPAKSVSLAPGSLLEVKLATAVDLRTVAIGDLLPAFIDRAVEPFQKGARATLHIAGIRQMRRRQCVKLSLTAIENPRVRARVHARLDMVQLTPAFGEGVPEEDTVCLAPSRNLLPAGLKMRWKTGME